MLGVGVSWSLLDKRIEKKKGGGEGQVRYDKDKTRSLHPILRDVYLSILLLSFSVLLLLRLFPSFFVSIYVYVKQQTYDRAVERKKGAQSKASPCDPSPWESYGTELHRACKS